MKTRLGRTMALLAVLTVAAPTAHATDIGPQLTSANNPSTAKAASSDKAAEAQRLAAMAAQLAQQAAQLAAESEAESTSAGAASNSPQTNWSTRSAAESTTIATANPAASGTTAISGWRTHRKPEDIAIRFKGQETPSEPTTTMKATSIAAIKPLPPTSNIATANHGPQTIARGSSELEAAAAGALAENEILPDTHIKQAASTLQNEDLIPEPEPVPPSPYADRNGMNRGRKRVHNDGVMEEPLPVGAEYGVCDPYCCPPQRVLFWTAGVEATFLNPDLNESNAQFGVVEFDEAREDYFDTQSSDVDSFYLAPRLWIGVQGCKWGMNLRYFHLRANEGAYDPVLGSDGSWDGPDCGVPDFGYSSCNSLEAYTIDLEVTRRVCLHECLMQFSMGVRHAELIQDEQISGAALAEDSTVFGFANAHRQSRGTGLVFGWYGRRPIFPCSCVHWFYNARFSTVWGPTQTAAETGVLLAQDSPAVANAGSVNNASTYVDDTMFIGEIQLGLEWDYALRCLPANAFFRTAVEYQRWDGGRGFSAAYSFAGTEVNGDPVTFSDAFASATEPQLDLIGITFGTGLTW